MIETIVAMKAVLFQLPCGASRRRLLSLPRLCGGHCCPHIIITKAADPALPSRHHQPSTMLTKKRFLSIKKRDPSKRISPAAAIQAFLETTNTNRTMINQPNASSVSPSSSSLNQLLRERQVNGSSTSHSHNTHSTITRTDIHRLKVAELRSQLAARGLDTTGTKKELVPRLIHEIFDNNNKNALTLVSATVGEASSSSSLCPASTASINHPHKNHQNSEEELADANLTYFLTVKGQSGMHSNGTGIGIVLSSTSSTDPSNDHDYSDEEDRWEARQYFARGRTGFEALYTAAVLGMRYALRRCVKKLVLRIDHHVIYNQLIGTWKVDRESLKPLYWNVMHMKESLDLFLVQDISSSSALNDTDDVFVAKELAQIALATGVSYNIEDGLDPMTAAGDNDNQVVPEPDHQPEVMNPDHDDMDPTATTGTTDISPSSVYLLRFDGGSRGNRSGVSGAGVVLYNDKGREIWCGWTFLGSMSNNAAEYWACLLGLRSALSMGIRHILVQGDSELIVRHLNGTYQVKDAALKKLWKPARDILAQFDTVKVEHIYRADNKRADFLANHAMDTETSHGLDVEGNSTQELESVF